MLGIFNPVADALSHLQLVKFKQLVPDAEEVATPLLLAVAELLQNIPHAR